METKKWGLSILNNWERTLVWLESRESLKMLPTKEHIYVLITAHICQNVIILKAQYFKRVVNIISIFLYKEGYVFYFFKWHNFLQNKPFNCISTFKWNTFFFFFTLKVCNQWFLTNSLIKILFNWMICNYF